MTTTQATWLVPLELASGGSRAFWGLTVAGQCRTLTGLRCRGSTWLGFEPACELYASWLRTAWHHGAMAAHMPVEEFRRHGHEVVDWIADYLERIDTLPVLPEVKPGDIVAMLPDRAPEQPEV